MPISMLHCGFAVPRHPIQGKDAASRVACKFEGGVVGVQSSRHRQGFNRHFSDRLDKYLTSSPTQLSWLHRLETYAKNVSASARG